MSCRLASVAALAVFALFGAGCRGPEPSGASARGPRVISLHDVTTELVVALGSADRLVGVAELVDASAELHAATAGVPRVGELETMLAVRPDVVLGLEIVRQKSPDLVRTLERQGKSVYLPQLASLGDVDALIHEVARKLGVEQAGKRLAGELWDRIGPEARPHGEPVPIFVYDCCDPPFTAGKKTVLSDLIARVGGRNVFGDTDASFLHVSWEEVISRRPARVVIHSYVDGNRSDVASKIEAMRALPDLRRLPVTVMPLRYSLGGLHIGDAAAVLRAALPGPT
jgi:iron complex transport system substrate-binding protein